MVPHTGRMLKSAIFGPTLSVVQQMVLTTGLLWKSEIVWPFFVSDAPNGPAHRLTSEKGNIWSYFVSVAPNGPT